MTQTAVKQRGGCIGHTGRPHCPCRENRNSYTVQTMGALQVLNCTYLEHIGASLRLSDVNPMTSSHCLLFPCACDVELEINDVSIHHLHACSQAQGPVLAAGRFEKGARAGGWTSRWCDGHHIFLRATCYQTKH